MPRCLELGVEVGRKAGCIATACGGTDSLRLTEIGKERGREKRDGAVVSIRLYARSVTLALIPPPPPSGSKILIKGGWGG